jgi:hypothetical protein
MEPSFRHEEVFPLIVRLINMLAARSPGYIGHEQIVEAILSDHDGALVAGTAGQRANWDTDRQAASNMMAWFSQRITVGASAWAAYFDREKKAGTWAYRPKTVAPVSIAQDVDITAIEGEPLLFFHLRRERCPALRTAKREAELNAGNPLCCEACGLTSKAAFPGLLEDILEVHHRHPLSAVDGSVVTSLSDLALLCPNCHRAIHRTKPYLSVDEFRTRILPLSRRNAIG